MSDQEISEAIDRIVDTIEDALARTADELGLDENEVADRVANELKARAS